MIDNRTPLKAGTRLWLGGMEYMIRREMGRGGSSIVYDAEYTDRSAGQNKRSIRIKEYYPYYCLVRRMEDGKLVPGNIDSGDFGEGMGLFEKAYNECVYMRESGVLTNYTVNAENIYDCNNTKYILMTYDEGRVYENDDACDGDVISVLRHIKAIADIMLIYHEHGLLYLDLKPGNVLALSGSKPVVKLFDFDSVVHIEEVQKGKTAVFSSSRGFSPPEQRQMRMVSESSDIFSIGALLFYKLFGRTVTDRDCELYARYDFGAVRKIFEGCINAGFAREIQDFFSKTIRTSVKCRYSSVKEALHKLDELIKYAGKYEITSGHIDCPIGFIGRNDELDRLHKLVRSGKITVIRGMGGIGKKTLARYYAYTHQNEYDHILHLKYNGNILNTFNDKTDFRIIPDIKYNGSQESFDVLIDTITEERLLTDKDMIILEDMNEKDMLLDCNTLKFLRLPCRFLITTEIDYECFERFEYNRLELRGMTDGEAYELFERNNDEEYTQEEKKRIYNTIKSAGNHTLFVKLFARGLSRSFDSVSQIYADGVGNLLWGKKNIFEHLEVLVDTESFDEAEDEIMRSLSLLDCAHINARLFISFFNAFNAEEYVRELIDRGLIEFHSKRLSLHPIVSSIVYDRLKPDTENCPSITKGITELIKNENHVKSREAMEELELVKESFLASVKGNDDLYARFLVEFCRATNDYDRIPGKLMIAERICTAYESREHYDMLKDIYLLKLTCIPVFYHYLAKIEQFAVSVADTALEYMRQADIEYDEKVRFYFEMAGNLGNVVLQNAPNMSLEGFKLLSKKTDALYDEAFSIMENSGLSDSEKQEKTEEAGMYYYALIWRAKHYLSNDKYARYKEKAALYNYGA